jgi:hypothetical protein
MSMAMGRGTRLTSGGRMTQLSQGDYEGLRRRQARLMQSPPIPRPASRSRASSNSLTAAQVESLMRAVKGAFPW